MGRHSKVPGQHYAKWVLEVGAVGAHNIVTYFTDATKLRGTAVRSWDPGGGCRIGVSAMHAGFLFPCLCRTEENLLDQPISSAQPRGQTDVRASVRQPAIMGARKRPVPPSSYIRRSEKFAESRTPDLRESFRTRARSRSSGASTARLSYPDSEPSAKALRNLARVAPDEAVRAGRRRVAKGPQVGELRPAGNGP